MSPAPMWLAPAPKRNDGSAQPLTTRPRRFIGQSALKLFGLVHNWSVGHLYANHPLHMVELFGPVTRLHVIVCKFVG